MEAGGEGGEGGDLQHDGCSDTHSDLNDEHEKQGDDEAAYEGLAALAHADNDCDAGKEPYDANENEEALKSCHRRKCRFDCAFARYHNIPELKRIVIADVIGVVFNLLGASTQTFPQGIGMQFERQ